MGTTAGVGLSHHRNPLQAGREAVERALEAAGGHEPDFAFMFASVGYDQRTLLSAVRDASAKVPLIGCSGEGIIAGGKADESNFAVSVMTIASDELRFDSGIATGLTDSATDVGREIKREIRPLVRDDALGLFVLADGLSFNFDRFLAGLDGETGSERFLPLFGGTAGDNWRMERTYQYCDDQIVSDGVAYALVQGPAKIAWAVNHGCVPIGGERKVTRCDGNLIYEIDGKPVLDVLKEYLIGDEVENWQKAIVNLCLGFKAPGHMEEYDDYLIRFMPARDENEGSITIPTEVSEGTSIWMTRRDVDKISAGVARMGSSIKSQLGENAPKMVFQFDCAGRGKVIFREQQKNELLRSLQDSVQPDAPWIGFYTYGEIGPVGGENCFHNYTAVVAALY